MSEQHPEIPIDAVWGPINGVLIIHEDGECLLEHCPIHHPSGHPLATAPLQWRDDLKLMERVCIHGFGHPDVDSLDFINAVDEEMAAAAFSVHACDGCCGLFAKNRD